MCKHRFSFIKYLAGFAFIFIWGTVFSQQTVIDKFKSYENKTIQEKLFLHSDKEFYVAGEILWFKIYYANGITHQPLQLSKVAYVEVLNEKNESVLQAKISLNPEESKGSFYLPPSLKTGNYVIRAYTNWMKNFGAEYFFEKKITIVNTLKVPEIVPATNTSSTVTVNFFPEGGALVSNMQSKIGFIVTNSKGGVNNFHGYIIDKNSDTITSFTPLKFGIGSFELKPLAGNTYHVKIIMPDGSVIQKALPEISDDGYVMKVKDAGAEQVEITVQRKKMQGEEPTAQILLAAHSRQVLHVVERSVINDNGVAVFLIDKKKISKGVINFTLFNSNNKPLCERLFYVKPLSPVLLDVKTDRKLYETRQKINLFLNIPHNPANNALFNLSASVFNMDTLQKGDQSNIFEYMWLLSDIPGNIESPAYYFSNDPDVDEATDNLMLTYGWRKFRWDDIFNEQEGFIKYLPEIHGQVIMGKIKDIRDDQPVVNADAYLSITGNPFGFYTARSDKNGIVKFEVREYYANRQVIAQPGIEADSFYKVEIQKPFSESEASRKYAPYLLSEEIKNQLLQKSISMQVQNIYSGDSLRNFRRRALPDIFPFYGKPETEYNLDDYKRFTTMEEVLREYVLGINVMLRNGKPELKIFNPAAHDFYNGYALVLLDGVPLSDINKIFSYDPLKVKKLDVIQTAYMLGQSKFNGIASFSTYDGVFDGFELNPKLVAIDYDGLQLQREFYSPVYETKEQIESRLPDFRNTLLWSPDIITDREGKAAIQLYSCDRKGKYIIVVQGMSENGELVSGTTTFDVK